MSATLSLQNIVSISFRQANMRWWRTPTTQPNETEHRYQRQSIISPLLNAINKRCRAIAGDSCRAEYHARQWHWPMAAPAIAIQLHPKKISRMAIHLRAASWAHGVNRRFQSKIQCPLSALLAPNFTKFHITIPRTFARALPLFEAQSRQ